MSSKEETSTAAVAPATTAATGGSATGFSYANVLQNVDAKKAVAAAAPAPVAEDKAVATTNNRDEKENQPELKTNKSWCDDVEQEVVLSPATVAGEKRAAVNTDTAAENSSEIDDNGDFVPVVSNSRRDRKKARKEKPSRDGRNVTGNQGQGQGGPKSGPRQRGGNGGTGGGAGNANSDKDGERKYPPRQRQRNGSPRKSNGGPKGGQKEPRKDASPSASAENASSGNEAKTGDGETQAQNNAAGGNAAAANPNPQPKKFVAAPPPKVNAWKVSGYLKYLKFEK